MLNSPNLFIYVYFESLGNTKKRARIHSYVSAPNTVFNYLKTQEPHLTK